jgi:hypothetical protein
MLETGIEPFWCVEYPVENVLGKYILVWYLDQTYWFMISPGSGIIVEVDPRYGNIPPKHGTKY